MPYEAAGRRIVRCHPCGSAWRREKSARECSRRIGAAQMLLGRVDRALTGSPARSDMAEASGLMRGKRGLIMGVANNRSIAWGIAKAARAHGADIALPYQGEAFKKRVEPLADEIDGMVVGHCDVSDEATIDAVIAE